MRQPLRLRFQLWSFAYLAVRHVLSLELLILRRSESKEIELLVLRHELEILRRNQTGLASSRPIGRGSPR